MGQLDFVRALENQDLDLLAKVQKADLHNHASLGFRKPILEKWLGKTFPDAPESMENFSVFTEYLNKHFHPIIYSREGFEFSIKSALKQAKDDTITELEMSIDSQVPGLYDEGASELAEFLLRVHAEVAPEIHFKPEIGVNREIDPDIQYERVVPMIESGVFRSIDLYGNEMQGDPKLFVRLFQFAGAQGLKRKAHAGEYQDAEFVRHSVEVLELDEVQHGISVGESAEVMAWLRREELRLNICPTSNLRLGRVSDITSHPIRKIVDAGVAVTVNSDDILVFNKSVSEEYLLVYLAGHFSPAELNILRENSLR